MSNLPYQQHVSYQPNVPYTATQPSIQNAQFQYHSQSDPRSQQIPIHHQQMLQMHHMQPQPFNHASQRLPHQMSSDQSIKVGDLSPSQYSSQSSRSSSTQMLSTQQHPQMQPSQSMSGPVTSQPITPPTSRSLQPGTFHTGFANNQQQSSYPHSSQQQAVISHSNYAQQSLHPVPQQVAQSANPANQPTSQPVYQPPNKPPHQQQPYLSTSTTERQKPRLSDADFVQYYLDENQDFINVILNCRARGDEKTAREYQMRLQQNLLLLSTFADVDQPLV